MSELDDYIKAVFGVEPDIFQSSLELSPGSQGAISGAISEILLKNQLERSGFEVIRIKEKPSGGNDAKNQEARGDFYVRRKGSKKNEWWVIESKGLKSNSEFRGGKLDCAEKVYKFLKSRTFDIKDSKKTYATGYAKYTKAKESWESKNKGKTYPVFSWTTEFPGPDSYDLDNLWKNEIELKKWAYSLPDHCFTEESYRNGCGAISILETHQPSKRISPIAGIDQAAPLVTDFNVMAVDLFFRTRVHEFVFMDSKKIAHSPTSPEHLYQNYTIDILVPNLKSTPVITFPWFRTFEELLNATSPIPQQMDLTQIDGRMNKRNE